LDAIACMTEYQFSNCRIDVAKCELLRQGAPRPIAPRILDLLVYLIEQRDRVVHKQELIRRVWGSTTLSEGVLAQAVSRARSAIGDSELIKTVHRVGYRFVGDLTVIEPPQAQSASQFASAAASDSLWQDPSAPPGAPSPSKIAALEISDLTLQASPPRLPMLVNLPSACVRPFEVRAMTFFASNEDVESWDKSLRGSEGELRLQLLIVLAWHLRQRDVARALALAEEAEALLAGIDNATSASWRARMMLVRAEDNWLRGRLQEATDAAQQAATTFRAVSDRLGICDAALLQAAIAVDRDDPDARDACVLEAMRDAQTLPDPERYQLLQLQLALADALRHPRNSECKWGLRVDHWITVAGPGVAATCWYVRATWAASSGDPAVRLRAALSARDLYAVVGQRRDVIRETGNIGAMFANMFDFGAALAWMNDALALARAANWPLLLGACLAQSAGVLGLMLRRPEDAMDLLDEAENLLDAFPSSRVAIQAQRYRGEVQQLLGRHELALLAFDRSAALARSRRLTMLEADALLGRAGSLSRLARPLEARQAANDALSLAEANSNNYFQSLALRLLGAIHRDHPELEHRRVEEPSVVLHYLLRAQARHRAAGDMCDPATLLSDLAFEYARLGDFANAYACQTQCLAAASEAQSLKVNGQAMAMKIQHDVESARSECLRHRSLATAHAARAAELLQENAALERMLAAARELACHREIESVFQALELKAHALLDALAINVYLCDPGHATPRLAFRSSAYLTPITLPLSDSLAVVARCAQERRELLVEFAEATPSGYPEAPPAPLALHVPLSVGQEMVGVLVARYPRQEVSKRDRRALSTLAAFGAIALRNALANQESGPAPLLESDAG